MRQHPKIVQCDTDPLYHFNVASVVPGGGGYEHIKIPLIHTAWPELPDALDAVIITGDLQAIASVDAPVENREMAGVGIATEIELLAECGLLPPCHRTGVILAGDLYTEPELRNRGGTGDVQDVWEAFATRFRWVVGVAGNHDLFYGKDRSKPPRRLTNAHLLDGDTVECDGILFAGISGIIGAPRKPWRRTESDFLAQTRTLLKKNPDLFVFHEAPLSPDGAFRGKAGLTRTLLDAEAPQTVVFGHAHWPKPMVAEGQFTFLNVDSRVVYATRAPLDPI